MNISEVIKGIDSLSDLYKEEVKSSCKHQLSTDAQIIMKLSFETIVKFGLTNSLIIKGFDFTRYKSDNDYIWYDELLIVLRYLEGLNEEERNQVFSPELSFFFGYLRFKLKYHDFSYNPQ